MGENYWGLWDTLKGRWYEVNYRIFATPSKAVAQGQLYNLSTLTRPGQRSYELRSITAWADRQELGEE